MGLQRLDKIIAAISSILVAVWKLGLGVATGKGSGQCSVGVEQYGYHIRAQPQLDPFTKWDENIIPNPTHQLLGQLTLPT